MKQLPNDTSLIIPITFFSAVFVNFGAQMASVSLGFSGHNTPRESKALVFSVVIALIRRAT